MSPVNPHATRSGQCLTDELVIAYTARSLDDQQARRVAAHLEQCLSCRARVSSHVADDQLATAIKAAFDADVDLATKRPALAGGPPAAAVHPPAIDGYDIGDEIHRGGQGVVFEAVQKATKRRVALKVLLHGVFATPAQRRRFEREIEMVAGLQHPSIVTIYDSGTTGEDHPYFAMEYIDGVPLNRYVEIRREEAVNRERRSFATAPDASFTLHDLLRLFLKVCSAIAYAHQHGVIHRDLKPSNVLIDEHGEPHVVDFGLAKNLEVEVPEAARSITLAGEFMGTVTYASPEQIRGNPPSDVRADVYSLGMILYELLTHHFPYRVTGALGDIFHQITHAEPEPPGNWYRRQPHDADRRGSSSPFKVDNELETIVLKCLNKQCDRRYQSVAELSRDILHYLAGEPIEAKRASTWYVVRKTLYRHRITALVVAAFLAVVAEAAFVSVIYWYQAVLDAQRVAHAEQAARERIAGETEARRNWELIATYYGNQLESLDPDLPATDSLLTEVFGVHRHGTRDDQPDGPPLYDPVTGNWNPDRRPEAEAILLELHDLLFRIRGLTDPRTTRTMELLADLYESWGRPADAAAWRERIPSPPPPGAAELTGP